ncbi:putative prophage-encoded outer membrane protein [Escherichia coli]|nr:putative prophage-encoded outer membrane protein [Escherichia coli]
MRKLCAVILSAVVWLVAAGTPASAAEHQSTLSAGYLQTHTDMPGSDDLKGINVKYRYEFTDTLGLVTSFSYAGDRNRQLTRYSDTRWHEDSVRNRWFSVMAGPSVRVNEWFSAYAMAGVAYSRVSTFSGDYLRVTDNKGKTHDVLTGSDDGRHSNTSLAWGAGVQFNPTESVAIDIAYEGSGSGAKNADISGSVNANSGTLNNVTINENCQIKGKLSANQIEGDIVKTVSKSFPRTSTYASGTITVRISDDQKFDRQVMIPPVLFRGGKHENFNSNNQQSYWYSTCRLRVTRNGQEIFNQSTTDAQGVFSSVIDMPAGQGTLTLTFTVSSSGANNWTPTTSISDLLVVVMKKSTAGISIS